MEVELYSLNDVIVLKLIGRVESYSTALLRKEIDSITIQQPSHIIIDLANVSFMDSSGLAILVYGMNQCRKGGGNFCLCNPTQPIRMILELTRLDQAMAIFPNTAQAVASLRLN